MTNTARLLVTLTLTSLLAACAPQTLWQSGDIKVEKTSDPDVKKVIHDERVLYYKVQDGMAYLDSHIVLGPVDENGVLETYLETQGSSRSNCIFWIFCGEYRWPLGIVPYTIHDNIDEWQLGQIERAIDDIQATTNILLVPKEAEHKNYIRFEAGRNPDACVSYLGMKGGRQTITLAQNGCSASAVRHEIGHALGLMHEHQRCDRAKHIKIHWGQIKLSYIFNFLNMCFMGEDHGDYDPRSNMHYSAYSFNKGKLPTITLLDGTLPYPSSRFTDGDLNTIEAIYAKEYEKRQWQTPPAP